MSENDEMRDESTAIVLYRGRTTHRVDGHEPNSNSHMGAPKLACGKELPFWRDRYGNKVLHPWQALTVREAPRYNPCPICWPVVVSDETSEQP